MKYIPITKISEIRKTDKFKETFKSLAKLPGYYKWWADENITDKILDKLDKENKKTIKQYYLEQKDGLFCIYVGITTRPIKARLKEHIFKHSDRLIINNFLSTLRKSISTLFNDDMRDETTTNAIIDKLYVECFVFDEPKDIADKKIKQIEANLLKNNSEDYNNKLYILNIDINKHPYNQNKKLKSLRKESRENALKIIELEKRKAI